MIIDLQKLELNQTPLCELMMQKGSDKAGGWHNYTLVYDALFKSIKNKVNNFFELGIGTINSGASLRAWKEYFSKANIFGGDILDEVLFTDHRIQTFHCDQTNLESIKKLWSKFETTLFDVILDDGLHEYNANIFFFENSIHKVKKGGFYFIEDIKVNDIPIYLQYFENCNSLFQEYQLVDLPNDGNKQDNVLLIIKK